MATILGISAYYHDSAAALVSDGEIVAAAQEERFTRKKHDPAFPTNAVEYCLREAGLQKGGLDYIAYYEKPLTKFDRLLESQFAGAPAGLAAFMMALPEWLRTKLRLPGQMKKALGEIGEGVPLLFPSHHESHAASAFFPSPFEESAILTLDGVGEWECVTMGMGKGKTIEMLQRMEFPHSLGLLYSAITYFCGFKVNSGEYKLMGLAPYGDPKYVAAIKDNLLDLKEDGSFRLNLDYFGYVAGLRMTSPKMERLFDGPPGNPRHRSGNGKWISQPPFSGSPRKLSFGWQGPRKPQRALVTSVSRAVSH
jgi:carbamoyltransferase